MLGPRSTAPTGSSYTAGHGCRRSACPNRSFYGVLQAEDPVLPAALARDQAGQKRPWPEWVAYRPCQVRAHDSATFARAGRDALVILDLVSRTWMTTLLVPRGRGESVRASVVSTRALELEGLLVCIQQRMVEPDADELLPVLLTESDNGPQMTSAPGGSSWPLHALAMHAGRAYTDQAHSETSSHTSRSRGSTSRRSTT